LGFGKHERAASVSERIFEIGGPVAQKSMNFQHPLAYARGSVSRANPDRAEESVAFFFCCRLLWSGIVQFGSKV